MRRELSEILVGTDGAAISREGWEREDLCAASFWSLLALLRSHWPLQNTGCRPNWYISIVHNAEPNSDFAATITCNSDGELPARVFGKWKALCMTFRAERRLKSHAIIISLSSDLCPGQFEYQKEYNVTYYSYIRYFLFSQTGISPATPYTKHSVLMVRGEYICIRKCDVAYFYNFLVVTNYAFYVSETMYWLSHITPYFLTT